MRIIRFLDPAGQTHFGAQQPDGSALRIEGDILAAHTLTTQKIPVAKLLAPIVPAAVLAIGQNYRRHAAEMKSKVAEFPVLFMKSPACLNNPGDPIQIPTHLQSNEVDFEVELAVVIGKRAKNVPAADALHYVLGYTIANDVTARDWQKTFGGGQWCRGKGFDTFLPLGPAIVTPDEIPDPNTLALSTTLNGTLMQSSSTADMHFNVQTLIAFLSGSTTLLPGTVIITGTPEGIGAARTPPVFLKPGDTLSMTIEKIGTLANSVINEP